jgi:hypothetical protein
MKGGRALSDWNKFTAMIYAEGKKKNPKYEFKDALKDASRRKGEMKHSSNNKSSKKYKKGSVKSKRSMVAGTRKRRRH